jgi:hypothetical protein
MLDSGINVSCRHLIYGKVSVKISLILSRMLQQTAHCYTKGTDIKQTGIGSIESSMCVVHLERGVGMEKAISVRPSSLLCRPQILHYRHICVLPVCDEVLFYVLCDVADTVL